MKKLEIIGLVLALFLTASVMADEVRDERIDSYLNILSTGNVKQKSTMLNRLQWSGLSDPRLFDVIEKSLLDQYLSDNLSRHQAKVLVYMVRSLGYSGNKKYRSTISTISKGTSLPKSSISTLSDNRTTDSFSRKLNKHAAKALVDLHKFSAWNALIKTSDLVVVGKNAEITTYMKMLDTDDIFIQRLAARAMFHENIRDPDLLALAANKLKFLYMLNGLDRESQDTAAWLCKAIGQSGQSKYKNLLMEIAGKTPYKKIRKYAQKFSQ